MSAFSLPNRNMTDPNDTMASYYADQSMFDDVEKAVVLMNVNEAGEAEGVAGVVYPRADPEIWIDAQGKRHFIPEMSPRHALNCYEFLHRRARLLAWKEIVATMSGPLAPRGEMACDAVEEIHMRMMDYPHEWLDTEPMVRELMLRGLDPEPRDMFDDPDCPF